MLSDFNSKMVRLKESFDGYYNDLKPEFQFQDGTIKRNTLHSCMTGLTIFQFQDGTIKRQLPLVNTAGQYYFNSKMVRLKDK